MRRTSVRVLVWLGGLALTLGAGAVSEPAREPDKAVPAPAPAPATQEGWTQVDVWQQGIAPTSPYTGDTRTATFNLYVKDRTGKYVAKEVTLEMPNGKTFSEMITDFGAELNECIEMGYQFTWESYGNSITIWPTDYGSDPDKEGSPKNYPDSADNQAKARKESHPV